MKIMKKNFVALILAIGIMVMNIRKKNLPVLILAIAIIASASVMSFLSVGGEAKNGTVLGITLGKSLGAVGLRECCRSEGTYSFKSYDNEDSNCYQTNGYGSDACFTQVISELSFDMTINVILLDNCDRQSPVQEIRATFGSSNYEKVLSLMIGKFGKPKKTESSLVQNSMGINFEKIESFWNKRGLSMYLTNIHNETDLGLLQIARRDKERNVAERSQKESEADHKQF